MKVNIRQIINYHRMIFIIKSCVRCRLINEKLNNAKSIGKGLSFFTATSLATCGVIGLFELLSLVFDGLSFLGDKRVGVIVFIIASIVSLVLAKSDYYENLHDYIDTLDDETLRKTRKRDVMIVIMTGSVFWVALLSIIIKAIVTQYL